MSSDDSAEHMVPVTAKVPPPLKEDIEAASVEGEPRSAAIRRLIRAGLESQTEDTIFDRLRRTIGVIIVMGLPTLYAHIGGLTVALLLIGIVAAMILFAPQIDDLRNYVTEKLP